MQEPLYAKSEREEKDMNEKEQMETQKLVRLAAEGDKGALEQLLTGVQDLVLISPCVCWGPFMTRRMRRRKY